MRLGGPNFLDDRLEIGFHWGNRHIAIMSSGGRNRSRTCDLFLVMEALVPTELCALRGSLAYSIHAEGRCEIAGKPSS